jgi:hypothetical protein
LKASQKVVTPAKDGVQKSCNRMKKLDSGFRRNDGKMNWATFYEFIKNWKKEKRSTGDFNAWAGII